MCHNLSIVSGHNDAWIHRSQFGLVSEWSASSWFRLTALFAQKSYPVKQPPLEREMGYLFAAMLGVVLNGYQNETTTVWGQTSFFQSRHDLSEWPIQSELPLGERKKGDTGSSAN